MSLCYKLLLAFFIFLRFLSISQAQTTTTSGLSTDTTTLSGTFYQGIADDFIHKNYSTTYTLESGGKIYTLQMDGEPPRHLTSGAQVTVTGKLQESSLLESTSLTTNSPQALPAASLPLSATAVTGDIRTVVLLLNFSNDPNNRPFTLVQISSTLFTGSASVNHYYQETSFGSVSFSGDVFGWYTIPSSLGTSCNAYQWATEANTAATAAGVNLNNYSKKIYVFPHTNVCPWGGMATLGGDLSWNNGYNETFVFAHELGHNLGIHHAAWIQCGTKAVDEYSNCAYDEYGDLWDIMGWLDKTESQFNAPHKVALGWIPPGRVQEATANGIYSISPLEVSTSGIQALKVRKPNTSEFYYLEYRQPIGLDAPIPSGNINGAMIHVWGEYAFDRTKLIDTTPRSDTRTYDQWKSRDIWDAALADQRSFNDTINDITITQLSHDASSVTVSVAFNCTPSTPTLTLSPSDQFGMDGSALNYSVTLTNHDTPFCPTTRFSLNTVLPPGWSSTPTPPFLDLAPQASGSAVLSVTSAQGASPGSYDVTLQGVDSYDLSHVGSATVRYTVLDSLKSARSGNWSDPTTWDRGIVPTASLGVIIQSGHTVTLDIPQATASITTLNGTLRFSRSADSQLTLVAGDLSVNPSGVLDVGTETDPVPPNIHTSLVLAQGSFPGQYGLVVQNGGVFTVRGANKTSLTTATQDAAAGTNSITVRTPPPAGSDPAMEASWSVGDKITISQTRPSYGVETERRTITSISVNPTTMTLGFSEPLQFNHITLSTMVVANLTRNVVIRSSGTDIYSDTSYIRNLTQSTPGFNLAYGEFAFLGADVPGKYGITWDGTEVRGSVSNCTIRDGNYGIYVEGASGNTLSQNLLILNFYDGIYLNNSSANTLVSNYADSNQTGIRLRNSTQNLLEANQTNSNSTGIYLGELSDKNTLKSNLSGFNLGTGINLYKSSENTLVLNNAYSNSGYGLFLGLSQNNILTSNDSSMNYSGTLIQLSSGNILLANHFYSNTTYGVFTSNASKNTIVEGGIGYDSNGNARPNARAEIQLNTLSSSNLTLRGVRLNPTPGISLTGFNRAGNSILSYNQNGESGILRLWGDTTLSEGALALDYASALTLSTATIPKLMRGSGHSASVSNTYETSAISQLITLRRDASSWRVEGSVSGLLGTFTGSIVNQPFPSTNPQFNLTLTEGPAQEEDQMDFALLAGSQDANTQKKLLLGPSAPTWKGGRSQLTLGPNAAFHMIGSPNAPSLMDRLDPSTPYYTFIASGAFTLSYSTITNTDERGIQLSGAGGVSLSSSTFDLAGPGTSSTATYITATDLTSRATFYGLVFNNSKVTSPLYNIRVQGRDEELLWVLKNWGGERAGEAYNDDPNNKIVWYVPPLDSNPPTASILSPSEGAMLSGSVTLSAHAVDDTGVAAVQFKLDGNDLGSEITYKPPLPLSVNPTLEWDTLQSKVPDGTHALTLAAKDGSGNTSTSMAVYFMVDNTTPSIPTGLMLTSAACDRVEMAWNPSTDTGGSGLQGYHVFRNGELLNIVLVPNNLFTDTVILPSTLYSYQVSAIDNSNNESGLSATLPVTTPACPDPAPTTSILSPLNGSKVKSPVSVTISGSDNIGITRIELWANGSLAMSQTLNPPLASFNITLSWPMYTSTAQLQAKAYDTAGQVGISNTVNITRIGKRPVSLVKSNDGAPLGITTVNDMAESSSDDGKVKALLVSPAQGYDQSLLFNPEVSQAKVLRMNGSVLLEATRNGNAPIVINLQNVSGNLPESGLYLISTLQDGGASSMVPMLLAR
ncbi:MAG: right-handed parallel beta-helix repeat-containing protein [Elusimicrobia bacterium]|nr:right-handed parallel beta-helix repeat-containing protein [Elusimicrobiota bacterium]